LRKTWRTWKHKIVRIVVWLILYLAILDEKRMRIPLTRRKVIPIKQNTALGLDYASFLGLMLNRTMQHKDKLELAMNEQVSYLTCDLAASDPRS
jgi:hypothetical protein